MFYYYTTAHKKRNSIGDHYELSTALEYDPELGFVNCGVFPRRAGESLTNSQILNVAFFIDDTVNGEQGDVRQ